MPPRRVAAAALLALLAPVLAAAEITDGRQLSAAEAAFCESEVTTLEGRLRLYRAQDLPESEIRARNAAPERMLRDCLARFRAQARRADARQPDADAPATSGGQDASVRRTAVSALLCTHQRRLDRARAERDAHQRRPDAERGDRSRLYALQAEIRLLEGNVEAERAELAGLGGALPCAEPAVVAVERCASMDSRLYHEDVACRGEAVREYLRAGR